MFCSKTVFLAGLLGAALLTISSDANAADSGRGGICRRGDRLNIQDLDMSPDPVFEGQRGREHCFNVQVDLDGSRQQIDADRRFCASQRTMWSMRESDDRWRSDR